jgi:hypothetical protein
MKKFLMQIAIFMLLVILILSLGLFLPATSRSKSESYFIILKDSLLANVDSPRMIFIGGSNLSYGLNSQMIKDSLNVNPINMGITTDVGLIKYIFDKTAQYLKKGDIIIAPLEYHHFTFKYNHASFSLLNIVMVDKEYREFLHVQQMVDLLFYLPKYSVSKLDPRNYFTSKRRLFNQYGDDCSHWGMENRTFLPYGRLDDFNPQIIEKIKDFEKIVEGKGATFYLAYPPYLAESFYKSEDIIATICAELEKNFKVLGTPERYMMPDSLMFNTSYHLNKKGADIRTARLIEDIKTAKIPNLFF